MITIANNTIHTVNGLYSLNDLHKASDSRRRHKPNNFLRLDNTKALIAEIERCSDMRNEIKAIEVIQGGNFKRQGTWVCKELVYSYAMWISPKFALIVIRAFDEMMTRQHRYKRLMHLHREYDYASYEASKAGYALSYYGKKVKPVIQDEIITLEAEMQPQLPFEQVSISLPSIDSKEGK